MTQKRYKIELYLYCRPIESRIWSVERRHFQWPWTTPTPGFKVTLFFDAEYLRNGMRHRHSFNGILIGTYIRPTQQCHFEWSSVNLSDLAKYAMIWSIARPLCDSRARCRDTTALHLSAVYSWWLNGHKLVWGVGVYALIIIIKCIYIAQDLEKLQMVATNGTR